MSKPVARASLISSLGLIVALMAGVFFAKSGRGQADPSAGRSLEAATVASLKMPSTMPLISSPLETRRVWVVPPMPDQYQIVLKRSIFSRLGAGRGRGRSGEGTKTEELEFVLRGVAMQEGSYVAFVENMGKNSVLRLRSGEDVARGKLIAISAFGVDYEAAGKRLSIPIGCALDGTLQTPIVTAAATTQESPDGQEAKSSKKSRKSKDAPPAEPATAQSSEDPTRKAR